MASGTVVACPHCGAENPSGEAFCESCGKALPTSMRASPRIVGGDDMPTTAAGAKLVGTELQKATKSASTALLVVAIIQLVVGGILVAVLASSPAAQRGELNVPVLVATMLGVSAVFFGLWFWSRRSPLPATITGLVIYATLVAVNVISAISNLSQGGEQPTGLRGLGIGWLDIVILVVLSRGIGAALKSRRLADAAVA